MKIEANILLPPPQASQGQAPQQPGSSASGVSRVPTAQQQPGPQPVDAPYTAASSHHGWPASAEEAANGAGFVQQQRLVSQQTPADTGQHQHASLAPGQPAVPIGFDQNTQLRSSAAIVLPVDRAQHGGPMQSSPSVSQPPPASLSGPQHRPQQTQQEPWAPQQAPVTIRAGTAGLSAVLGAPGQPVQATLAVLPDQDTMSPAIPGLGPHYRTGEHGSAEQLPLNTKAEPSVLLSISQATADLPSLPAPASTDVVDLSQISDSGQSAGLTGAVLLPCAASCTDHLSTTVQQGHPSVSFQEMSTTQCSAGKDQITDA